MEALCNTSELNNHLQLGIEHFKSANSFHDLMECFQIVNINFVK